MTPEQAREEIQQHIGWLKMYVEGMSPENWRDMRLRCERQIEQLSAAMQRAARMEWQSMETAKQDGTFMFLFCPEDGSRWLAAWQDGQWYGVDDTGLTRSDGWHKGSDRVTGWEITAWMPLPASPQHCKEG